MAVSNQNQSQNQSPDDADSHQNGQYVDGSFVTRKQTTFADGSDGRVYVTDEDEYIPSVTTIAGFDPLKDLLREYDALYDDAAKTEVNEWANVPNDVYDILLSIHDDRSMWRDLIIEVRRKQKFLNYWKAKHAGGGDDEHYTTVRDQKADIGTIAHARSMMRLIADRLAVCEDCDRAEESYCLAHEEIASIDLWGEEEQSSEATIEERETFYSYDAVEHAEAAVEYIVEHVTDLLAEQIDELLYVEEYVMNKEIGYAGQIDIVYRHENGDVIACDLKTGKSIYHSYKMQLEAYARGLDVDVDHLQIIRVNPIREDDDCCEEWKQELHPRPLDEVGKDNKQAHIDMTWDETRDELFTHYEALCDLFYEVKLDGRPAPGRNFTDENLRQAIERKISNPINSESMVEILLEDGELQVVSEGEIALSENDIARGLEILADVAGE